MIGRFFDLHKKSQESDTQFVLRVEQTRQSIQADAVATYHAFVPRLGEQIQRWIATLKVTSKIAKQQLEWKDIVALCRDDLASGGTLLAQATNVTPQTPMGVQPQSTPPSRAPQSSQGNQGGRPLCDLCTKFKLGLDQHKREWCYCDP